MEMKVCTKCNKALPMTTEYFYKANNKCGFRSICIKCFKLDREKRTEEISQNYITRDKKICTVCGIEFPATSENFVRRNDSKDGLSYECKNCSSIRKKKYNEEHKEEISEKGKIYRDNNKEYLKECGKKYRDKNKEYYNEYNKKYYNENKEQIQLKKLFIPK